MCDSTITGWSHWREQLQTDTRPTNIIFYIATNGKLVVGLEQWRNEQNILLGGGGGGPLFFFVVVP